jgi:hypothetical protein
MSRIKKNPNRSLSFDVDVWNLNFQRQKYSHQLNAYFDSLCETITKLNNILAIPNINGPLYIKRTTKELQHHLIFRNIELFILDKNKNIHCINDLKLVFNKNNYQDVFKKLGYHDPPVELINCLYETLLLSKITRPYRSYNNYFKYKLQNKYSHCIFDCYDLFSNFDGNIFFDNKDSSKLNSIILLCEKTYKNPIRMNNLFASQENNLSFVKLKQPTASQFKTVIDYLRNVPLKTESVKNHIEQGLLQFIISYLQQNHQLAKTLPTFPNSQNSSDRTTVANFLSQNKKNDNFIKQLSVITDGGGSVLDQLAMMIARINLIRSPETNKCSNGLSPKITIILTSNVNVVKNFFEQLFPDERQKSYTTLHELCSKKAILENIWFKYNGGILQICEYGKSVSIEDLKILKKFVKGTPVRISDKVVGNLIYISNCHYVMLAQTQEEVIVYKNYFQNLSDVIVLDNGKVKNNTKQENTTISCNTATQPIVLPSLEKFDYDWVHIIFATYGLLFLADEKFIRSKRQPSLDLQTVVSSFLEECCTPEPKADCYAKDLYRLYRGYFMKNYGIEPVKRIHLVNILKADGHYPYCRLRHHAGDNDWGFKGIGIKKEKLEEYKTSNATLQSDQIEPKIANYLSEINKKIRPLLDI